MKKFTKEDKFQVGKDSSIYTYISVTEFLKRKKREQQLLTLYKGRAWV